MVVARCETPMYSTLGVAKFGNKRPEVLHILATGSLADLLKSL